MEDLWAFNEETVARAIYAANTPIISGTGHEIDMTIADYAADKRAPTPSAACEIAIPDVMGIQREWERLHMQMMRLMERRLETAREDYQRYAMKLQYQNPEQRLRQQKQYTDELWNKLFSLMKQKLERSQFQWSLLREQVHRNSPTARLTHGYGYLEKEGQPVSGVEQVEPDNQLKVTLHNGMLYVRVEAVEAGQEKNLNRGEKENGR